MPVSPLQFRRRAFTWLEGSSGLADSSTVELCLYRSCWLPQPLAALSESSKVQRSDRSLVLCVDAPSAAGWMICAATSTKPRHISTIPEDLIPGGAWRMICLLLDRADSLVPLLAGAVALVLIAQQLARLVRPPPLLLLTSGAQPACVLAAGFSGQGGAHGCCWGLARVLRLEQLSTSVFTVDLTRLAVAATAPLALATEAMLCGAEKELSWVGDQRHAARLRRAVDVRPTADEVRANGSCLITGGMGGLGLRAAAVMLDAGASMLMLSSRSGKIARTGQGLSEALTKLQAHDAAVYALACDVGDQVDALNAVRMVAGCGMHLCTKLHLAGVGDRGLIATMQSWRIAFNFHAKAIAAGHLHHATMTAALQAAISYSSVSCSYGNVGQGSYAVANATLDAISAARRERGLASSTLQWPLILEAGMGAAGLGNATHFRGMAAITLKQYSSCLRDALSQEGLSRLHSCPLPCDRQSLLDALPDASQGLFAELNLALEPAAGSKVTEVPNNLLEPGRLHAAVRGFVSELTGSQQESLSDDAPLMDSGELGPWPQYRIEPVDVSCRRYLLVLPADLTSRQKETQP